MLNVLGVYWVDFGNNRAGEFSGSHYGLVLSVPSMKDRTLLVAPITSKKPKTRYRGGIFIDCHKYQKNPTKDKAFIKVRKIREVHISRIKGDKVYDLDEGDKIRLIASIKDTITFLKE